MLTVPTHLWQVCMLLPRQVVLFKFVTSRKIIYICLFETKLFRVLMFKDSYDCEMGMRGTVRCRSTLAYRVHFDSINISD